MRPSHPSPSCIDDVRGSRCLQGGTYTITPWPWPRSMQLGAPASARGIRRRVNRRTAVLAQVTKSAMRVEDGSASLARPRIRPPRPRTARFRAGHVEERPYTSPVEAHRYRRSIYHTGPQTVRRPRRATRELDPSDDHRQTFDQREEPDLAGHMEYSNDHPPRATRHRIPTSPHGPSPRGPQSPHLQPAVPDVLRRNWRTVHHPQRRTYSPAQHPPRGLPPAIPFLDGCSRECWIVSAGYRRRQAEGGYNHDFAKRESAPGSRLVFNALSPHWRGPEDDKDGQEPWFTARIASLIG